MNNKKCVVCSNYTGKQYGSCSECKREDKRLSFAPVRNPGADFRRNQAIKYEQGWARI